MKVGGLDISLRSTGVAIIDDTSVGTITTTRVLSEPVKRADGLSPTLEQRRDRLAIGRARIVQLLGGVPTGVRGIARMPELVIVEGPSYGSPQGAHEMGGNWWLLVDQLLGLGVPVVEVSPPQVKQYGTGSGATSGKNKVTKEMVIAAVQANYGDAGAAIRQNDEADALLLAAIGARYLGRPIEGHPLPAANLAALKKIRWPERTLL